MEKQQHRVRQTVRSVRIGSCMPMPVGRPAIFGHSIIDGVRGGRWSRMRGFPFDCAALITLISFVLFI